MSKRENLKSGLIVSVILLLLLSANALVAGAVPVFLGDCDLWDTVVFRDDFDTGVGATNMPDPSVWVTNHPDSWWWVQGRTFFPSPTYHPAGPFPRVENGVCTLEHHLYNPYDLSPTPWTFLGGELHTIHQFEAERCCLERCYLFEARVRCDPYPNGLVTSFFTYGYDGSKSDEIDFEFVSNKTNDYLNYPNGDPVLTNPWDESQQCPLYVEVPGLDLTEWNTFRIYWYPGEHRVKWTWMDPENGERDLRTETDPQCVPDEPMSVYFNFWAPTEIWKDAYDVNLHPVSDPSMNEIYRYEIDYVEVRVSGPKGRIIYVDGNATNWPYAFRYLQDALDAAECGDEIWVADGIYRPDEDIHYPTGTGDRTATFQLKNCVALYGGFASGETSLDERDWRVNKTILSGDLDGDDEPGFVNNDDNSFHVVTGSGTDETAVLDGFTITGGRANYGPYPTDHGGGMFNESASPTVANCTFSGNSCSSGGGGMLNKGSSPTLTNCKFSGNSSGGGGGIANNEGSNPTLRNCLFSGNRARSHGGGLANWKSCSPNLVNCTFSNNESGRQGGGINNCESSSTLTNCILWDNTAPRGAQIYNDWAGSVTVSYSDIQGSWPGTGNKNADPLFINASSDDLRLLPDSPCIDAGDPNYPYNPDETDLDGKPRVIGGRIDMGAYESDYIEVAMKFTPQTLNCCSKGKWVKAHFVLPDGFAVEDVDANTPAMLYPGGIPSDVPMNVFINEPNFVEVEAAFDRADFCSNGPTEGTVTVVGLLSSGQSFYGTDTIRIITHNLEYVAVLAVHWLEANCGKPDWCSGFDLDQNSVVNFVDFATFDGCCIEIIK